MSDELPVPTTDQTYITIQPTTTGLDPAHVTNALSRLHALLQPEETTLLEDLENLLTLSNPPQPILEIRLQRPDAEHDRLSYAATLHQAPHTSIDALETTLRTIFPEDYQLTQTKHVPQLPTDHSIAGVEYTGTTDKPRDWQTCLRPYTSPDEPETTTRPRTRHTRKQSPLTAIADALASTPLPAIYQLLVQPLADWSNEAAKHIAAIETNTGPISKFFPTPEDTPAHREVELTEPADTRRDHVRTRQAHRSFVVNARVAVAAPQHERGTASHAVETLQPALGNVSGRFHRIEGQPTTDDHLQEKIQTREFHGQSYESTSRLRRSDPTSKGIVVDASELPHFLTIDGSELTTAARRALETVAEDRTPPSRPPDRALDPFHTDGLTIGQPRTDDATPTDPVAVPPDLQTRHAAWFGTTGSGKSTGLINIGTVMRAVLRCWPTAPSPNEVFLANS